MTGKSGFSFALPNCRRVSSNATVYFSDAIAIARILALKQNHDRNKE